MKTYNLNLLELINPPHTELISGRDLGETFARQKEVLSHIENGEIIIINIDAKIRAINDSFIKGFFSEIFKKYRTQDKVKTLVEIKGSEDFKSLFDKNLKLLDIIYNA